MNRVEQFNQIVRGAVTLGLTAAFIYGFVVAKLVTGEVFVATYSVIVTFWFVSRQQQQASGEAPRSP